MNWKSLLIAAVFYFIQSDAWSQQTGKDSLDYYIKNLGWHSFSLTPTYVHSLMVSNDAQSILDNATDKNKVAALLMKEIESKDKVLAVHVVLTRLFGPRHNSFKEDYIYSGDSIIAVNYTYNTLTWQFENKTDTYHVMSEEIERINSYWRKKLKRV